MQPPLIEETVAGHRVLFVEETASTNLLARRLAADGVLRPGDVVSAMRQSAGRGRRGRAWVTVPGRSIALTLLLDMPPLPRPASLGLLAAVATCRALERRGAPALRIKWPNDIVRAHAKVGGLLIEPLDSGRRVILGLGVNLALHPGDLPGSLRSIAGEVGLATDEAARRGHLAALLEEFDRALADPGPEASWRAEYRTRAWLPGRGVDLLHRGLSVTGVVAEVTADGDLVLADGRRLAGEHVELLGVRDPEEGGGRAVAR